MRRTPTKIAEIGLLTATLGLGGCGFMVEEGPVGDVISGYGAAKERGKHQNPLKEKRIEILTYNPDGSVFMLINTNYTPRYVKTLKGLADYVGKFVDAEKYAYTNIGQVDDTLWTFLFVPKIQKIK